jgi:hypothetical protein
MVICILFLLSFVVIKHETQMLSDIPYFCFSTMSLWSLVWSAESTNSIQKVFRFTVATSLLACAIYIRTIGIALVPAAMAALMVGPRSATNMLQSIREHKRAAAILVGALGVGVLLSIARSTYLQMAIASYRDRGLLKTVIMLARSRLSEWGEVAMNIPSHMLPRFVPSLLLVSGLIGIGFVGAGVWIRRNRASVVEVYTICYLMLLSVTPWADSRYLLPLLLLAISYVAICLKRLTKRSTRLVIGSYCVLYCVLGVAALAYSTHLSLSGSNFPEIYGDGLLRATYRMAFNARANLPRDQINDDALYLLRRYEPHAFRRASDSEQSTR